ncbi:MAG: hypothetical protein BWY76_00056 [bacterium ADurb.Bin429]|nr:MAG: hypothetical protein BWY76_00056 [bacterium ADurb.Bin429]
MEELPTPNAATTLRILALGGTYAHTDEGILEEARAAMGFDGPVAYTVEMETGAVLDTRLVLALDGSDGGAAFAIPAIALPSALPITAANLNPNWPAVLLDRDAQRWRPLGMLDGTAYATLDTEAHDWRVFIGHPVVATNPNVVLSLTQISDSALALEIHNPTGTTIETTVSPSLYFDLLDWGGMTLALAPGSSTILTLPMRVTAPL